MTKATPVAKQHSMAIFIDFENLVTRTGVTDATFDLQPALDSLEKNGRVVFKRAYCNWERFPSAREALHAKGVELIDVPPSTRSGKNGADIRLVVDALELAYLREHVDTFVIMSGDSDFCPLAYKLRENNRFVVGMAMKDSSSPLFVRACDEFIYLKTKAPPRRGRRKAETVAGESPIAPAPAPAEEPPAPAQSARGRPKRRRRGGAPVATTGASIPEVARLVVAEMLSRATRPLNPSAIKSAIVRRAPDFDVRAHGYPTFGRLIESMESEGLLKREQTTGGQWNVVPP